MTLHQVAPGQRLRETDWAVRLDVNRTAIREACGRLCAEGLVIEGPKGGYFAARLESEEMQDALEIRAMLETGAIERICRLGLNRPRHLKPLSDACDDLEWLLRKGYTVELAESDRRYHEALIAIAGSKRLALVYRCIPMSGPEAGVCDERAGHAAGETMLREHRAIHEAIQRGRVAEAQRLLRAHLVQRPPVPDADCVLTGRTGASCR
jgi:DNA-binding GntR family transcriptional regulator